MLQQSLQTSQHGASRTYRGDIDGLRAFAVTAVILTHAGVPGFTGGFVGVDVFFVISGFLIHRDLLRRAGEGRLVLLDFYGRRMRRTLPALFAVGAVTLLAASFVLLPSELVEMSRSLMGAVLLVPNIVFLGQTGYFDALAGSKPLLHCWSLGVEEQFYLLAPLLVLGLVRLPARARDPLLVALFVAALALCEGLRAASPSAAFYLMPARAFEFLVGAAVAQGLLPTVHVARRAEALTALGAAGLVASVALFSRDVPHPGVATLLPCLSTAAILGATRPTLVGRVLGLRLPAAIGLVSYSLYLWHWPILVLAHLAELPRSVPWLIGEATLLVALSAATWRWVEQPFRRASSPWRRRAPFLLPLGGSALLASAAIVAATAGLPGRFAPDVAAVAAFASTADARPFREGQCFLTSRTGAATLDHSCLQLADDEPNVLLLGDSHAAHLWTGLRDGWPELNVLQATASGCKPLLATIGAQRCTGLMRDMLEHFVPTQHLAAVVIAALWDEDDIAPLARTITALRPYVGRIVVIGPMPRYDAPAATLLARAMMHGEPDALAAHLLPATASLDARMRAAVSPLAEYVSPYRLLCPDNRCRLFAGPNVPLQFDYHHLTPAGSAVLAAMIRQDRPALFGQTAPQRSTSSR